MYKELIEQAQTCIELCEAWIAHYKQLGNESKVRFWRAKVLKYLNELNELGEFSEFSELGLN